ncbi:hypothetical protein, partial [Clostridioides difficile]|uniref:hypothetical protein n=1 Tax=Clostridioides difficile TaxID=1496 RepID=UPI002113B94D
PNSTPKVPAKLQVAAMPRTSRKARPNHTGAATKPAFLCLAELNFFDINPHRIPRQKIQKIRKNYIDQSYYKNRLILHGVPHVVSTITCIHP